MIRIHLLIIALLLCVACTCLGDCSEHPAMRSVTDKALSHQVARLWGFGAATVCDKYQATTVDSAAGDNGRLWLWQAQTLVGSQWHVGLGDTGALDDNLPAAVRQQRNELGYYHNQVQQVLTWQRAF